jgi:hypothetical protein
VDVVAFAGEVGMRPDAYLDQRIAWRTVARRWAAFAFKAQDLAVPRPRRNVDLERTAVRKDNRLLAAVDGIEEGKFETIAGVLAAAAAGGAGLAAEDLGEDVFGAGVIAEIGKTRVVGVGCPAILIGEIPVVLLTWPLGACCCSVVTRKSLTPTSRTTSEASPICCRD